MVSEQRTSWMGFIFGAWIVVVIAAATIFRAYRSDQEIQQVLADNEKKKQIADKIQTARLVGDLPTPAPQKSTPKPRAIPLFNGKNLDGWTIAEKDNFVSSGKVTVEEGKILLEAGTPATGIRTKNPIPTMNYEITVEARRTQGNDFFCGMTFPINDQFCTLIIGGWGGGLVGLSNIDGLSAADNEFTTGMTFENDQWYKIKLRVVPGEIKVWIDDDEMMEVDTTDRQFDIWWEQEPMRPFGISTWYSSAELKEIKLKRIPASKADQSAQPTKDAKSQ